MDMGHPQMKLLDEAPLPRVFKVNRKADISGVSGVGHVADGVMFYDGTTVIYWRTQVPSVVVFHDLQHLLDIHGHGGATTIEWVEPWNPAKC
jgi:hypothetical protein